MGFLLFPIFSIFLYGLPIIFYLLAHKIPNKKWLTIYGIFWSTILLLTIYDLVRVANLTDENADYSLGWVLVTGLIFLFCMASIVGVISKGVVLYLAHQGKEINLGLVHVTSFIAVQFVFPILIGFITFLISWILDVL